MKTNNAVRHDAETGIVTVTVIRNNGKAYDVLMDAWFFALYPEITIHVKATRAGRDEYYAATRIDGKLIYLHRLVGEAFLLCAATMKNNTRTTIDHKNRRHLDCTVGNLRAASMRDQASNRSSNRKKVA